MRKNPILLCLFVTALFFSGCDEPKGGMGAPELGEVENDPGDGQIATIAVFRKEDDGSYTETPMTLTMEVGAPCYAWGRYTERADEFSSERHVHYNAADNITYVDGELTWTEYGPEHSVDEIRATCEAGEDGVTKTVNATDYFEDHGEVVLRLTSVE